MRKLVFALISICACQLRSQTGWAKITATVNGIAQYTTNFPYVGAAFIDTDGDNDLDIIAAPNKHFVNTGNGLYMSMPQLNIASAGISGLSYADLDNDGDNDCIISCVPTKVFINQGGVFSDVTSTVPGLPGYGSWAVAIGDFNKDPKLDFIFAHANGFHPPSTPSPCKFYYQPSAAFSATQITGYPFTSTLSSYTNPFWSDYDLDGDMDLFIASGPVGTGSIDPCYKNMKIEWNKDTLVQMTTELFATQPQDGQCYNFIDYDNDKDLDLCLTNYYGVTTRLYQNNAGIYSIVATPFSNASTNLANCWGDYDNDGDLDVIITNDNQITRYYRNNGNGTFTYLSTGFTTPTAVCGITNGDYDNDGDLDVFVNGIGNNGNTSSVGLYKNDTTSGGRNWVNIKLIGTNSNRSAIGAIVRMKATINGIPTWQMREVNAQNSFQGQNDLRVHFGLNTTTTIDSITVRWPSGLVENFIGYMPNNFYQITEGFGVVNLMVKEYDTKFNVTTYPNPVSDQLIIEIPKDMDQLKLNIHVFDLSGKMLKQSDFLCCKGTLDVKDLPSGVYFIRISDQEKSSVQKFIKE